MSTFGVSDFDRPPVIDFASNASTGDTFYSIATTPRRCINIYEYVVTIINHDVTTLFLIRGLRLRLIVLGLSRSRRYRRTENYIFQPLRVNSIYRVVFAIGVPVVTALDRVAGQEPPGRGVVVPVAEFLQPRICVGLVAVRPGETERRLCARAGLNAYV